MKKILISYAVAAASIGSAFAADLPSRKEAPVFVPPPPPVLWNGFYVGVNAGGTFSASSGVNVSTIPLATDVFTLNSASQNVASLSNNFGGFIGGGQVGYNWQFDPNFVAGIEADIQGVAGGGGSNSVTIGNVFSAPFPPGVSNLTGLATTSASKSLDYLGTVRGRVGFLVTPTLLAFASGGLAYGQANLSASALQVGTDNFVIPGAPAGVFNGITLGSTGISDTRVGWTVGGGAEWMFLPNWSAKVEYLYYDLGNVTASFPALNNTPGISFIAQASTRFDGHIVRAGLNYHFNWVPPAPVVAKY